jgi:hypothetical protein
VCWRKKLSIWGLITICLKTKPSYSVRRSEKLLIFVLLAIIK